jgi:hypothetical protein
MTIRIVKSEDWYDVHTFSVDFVKKYGLEKACVIANLEKIRKGQKWSEAFPYIQEKRFNEILDELVEEGIIEVVEESARSFAFTYKSQR